MSDAVYIIDGARTPMGGLMGELSTLSAVNLGEVAIRSALEKSNLSGDDIDEVIMGCVLPSGLRQGPARQAAIDAGIPDSVGATTINKLCGSGMKSVMLSKELWLDQKKKIELSVIRKKNWLHIMRLAMLSWEH